MNKLSKGFTLIELLVVIAIVGILSGILIVSMSGATNAAKDGRIKADIDEMRSNAQIYATNNPTLGYGTIAGNPLANCNGTASTFMDTAASGQDARSLCTDISVTRGTTSSPTYPIVNSSATAYCIQSTLNAGGSWCVDSTGNAGSTNVSCASGHLTCN